MSIKHVIIILLLIISRLSLSQNLIRNGSFEDNITTHISCASWWAGTEKTYDSLIDNSNAIYFRTHSYTVHGIEILDSLCDGFLKIKKPQNKEWHIMINSWNYTGDTLFGHEGITLYLSSQLKTNHSYRLSFYAYSIGLSSQFESKIKIGLSNNPKSLGTEIHCISDPDTADWQLFEYDFTPTINANYLSVWAAIDGYGAPLTGIDNFVLTSLTGLEDEKLNTLKIIPNPTTDFIQFTLEQKGELYIYDLQGRKILAEQVQKGDNRIDISYLEKGVYIVEAIGVGRTKIIKN